MVVVAVVIVVLVIEDVMEMFETLDVAVKDVDTVAVTEFVTAGLHAAARAPLSKRSGTTMFVR